MHAWARYALIASTAFGLSAVPLKAAISGERSTGSEIILLTSCMGSLAGALLYFVVAGPVISYGSNRNILI